MSSIVTLRNPSGRFAAGQSGNPAGRPKGSRNRTTSLAEAIDEGTQEALVAKLVADALAGDRVLLRFCVERILGKPAERVVPLDLAPGGEKDPEAILAATMRALADGEISPAEAVRIARAANAIGRARLSRVQERYVEAGMRLREARQAARAGLRPDALRPAPRGTGQTATPAPENVQYFRSPSKHGAGGPENGVFSPEKSKQAGTGAPPANGQFFSEPLPATSAKAERVLPTPSRAARPPAPASGLLPRPRGHAALLASVSPLAFREAPPPEIDLFPTRAELLDPPRLAA